MHKSCSQNEHTGFEGEKQSGRMNGEIPSSQMIGEKVSGQRIGEKNSGQAQIHDCYVMSLVR